MPFSVERQGRGLWETRKMQFSVERQGRGQCKTGVACVRGLVRVRVGRGLCLRRVKGRGPRPRWVNVV